MRAQGQRAGRSVTFRRFAYASFCAVSEQWYRERIVEYQGPRIEQLMCGTQICRRESGAAGCALGHVWFSSFEP